MASKNFCDICDKPAVKQPEPIEVYATTLNESEGVVSSRYNNNKLLINVKWSIHNTYTDKYDAGHICAACLVEALNKHIEKLSVTPK